MGRDDRKMEIILEGGEVPALITAFAEALRNPVLPEAMQAFGPHLSTCSKFELSVKQLGGMAEFKIKAKGLPLLGERPAEPARPLSFKSLKRRLKTSYKYLQHCRSNLILPPAEVLSAFLADSRAMSEHPGRELHDYAPYLRLCDELKAACDAGDSKGFCSTLAKIEAAKKTCHAAAK